MYKLPTGPNEMAPLSEFVVTERKPKARERIRIGDWFKLQEPKPDYDFDVDNFVMTIEHKEPADYECFTSDKRWQIKWLG